MKVLLIDRKEKGIRITILIPFFFMAYRLLPVGACKSLSLENLYLGIFFYCEDFRLFAQLSYLLGA